MISDKQYNKKRLMIDTICHTNRKIFTRKEDEAIDNKIRGLRYDNAFDDADNAFIVETLNNEDIEKMEAEGYIITKITEIDLFNKEYKLILYYDQANL